MKRISGFINGIISSASFGMIPLFAIPVLQSGMEFMSVLLYRFTFATILLAFVLLVKRESFLIKKSDFFPLVLLAIFYIVSSVFLLWGYTFMSSGIATTIHFMYPVITTLIMMFFFRERKSVWRMVAVCMAIVGVFFLSYTGDQAAFNWLGVFIVLISSLGYALYLVALGQFRNIQVRGIKLTFYVFFLSTLMLWMGMSCTDLIQPMGDSKVLVNLLLLAFIPTVVSNLTLVQSIKKIGSTLTSVLGAMEPVTAVMLGILVFSEPFTFSIGLGILLIITAVIIIIVKR